MKKYKKQSGKTVLYGVANLEMNRDLRKLGHKVVADKKKQARKNACRRKEGLHACN